MVEIASGIDGTYGARMTGAGFGGCTVNLVRVDRAEDFRLRIIEDYERTTAVRPEVYMCKAASGVEEVFES
jgi:galactokinase